jgi:hypothetical protein
MAGKCSIIGCFGNGTRRGLCHMHYERMRLSGEAGEASRRQSENGAAWSWIDALLIQEPADDCILWPFAKSDTGYGSIFVSGRSMSAHRHVCKLAHGQPPQLQSQVAHSCGQRLCVNPRHLRWADQSANEMDKRQHGTHNRGERHPMAKLSPDQVREIRRRGDAGETHSSIAGDFSVARRTVTKIVDRESWTHVEEDHGV